MLSVLLLSFSLFVVGPLQAMKRPHAKVVSPYDEGATPSVALFMTLPLDILKKIAAYALKPDPYEERYMMHNDNECMSCEKLLIPYTLRFIDPIAAFDQKTKRPTDLKAKPGDTITLNTQLWQKRDKSSPLTVRLVNGTENSNDCFTIGEKHGDGNLFFDGINRHRYAIYANDTSCNAISFFALKQSQPESNFVDHGYIKPIWSSKGTLDSLMLHPDCNKIVYTTTSRECMNASVHDSYNYMMDFHQLTILEFDPIRHVCTVLAQEYIDTAIKKVVYLGKQTYLACTKQGTLASFWLDSENKLQLKMHTRKSSIPNQEVDSIMDIAVDNSYETASGFRPRFAYITSAGHIFTTSISEFEKSKTFLSAMVSAYPPGILFELFYDKGNLAVQYREHKWPHTYTDFIVRRDNLGARYFADAVARME